MRLKSTMAGDYLRYLIEYDAWANAEVLAFLGRHPALCDATTAGVFGTALETMNHLVTAEASYVNRLAGGPPFADLPDMPLDELDAYSRQVSLRAAAVVLALPPPERLLQRTHGRFAAETVFGQLILHGIEHRTQVCTIIGAAGLEPPDLTSWRFGGKV
jgi:uncharacterized damage-inducible protein DinB